MTTDPETILNTIPQVNYIEPAAKVDFDAFFEVVKSRRSVRVYDGTPIPEEVMKSCLQAALLAPNSSNLQQWEFFWVRTPDVKKRLVEVCLNQPTARTAAELVVAIARTKTWKQNARLMIERFDKSAVRPPRTAYQYYQRIVPLAYEMGPFGLFGFAKKLVVNILGLFRIIPREPMSQSDLRLWAVKSTALACENFILTMRAAGFDTCAMEGYDSARLKKLLKLPRDAVPVMVVSCGKRARNGVYGPQIRFDAENFIKEV